MYEYRSFFVFLFSLNLTRAGTGAVGCFQICASRNGGRRFDYVYIPCLSLLLVHYSALSSVHVADFGFLILGYFYVSAKLLEVYIHLYRAHCPVISSIRGFRARTDYDAVLYCVV